MGNCMLRDCGFRVEDQERENKINKFLEEKARVRYPVPKRMLETRSDDEDEDERQSRKLIEIGKRTTVQRETVIKSRNPPVNDRGTQIQLEMLIEVGGGLNAPQQKPQKISADELSPGSSNTGVSDDVGRSPPRGRQQNPSDYVNRLDENGNTQPAGEPSDRDRATGTGGFRSVKSEVITSQSIIKRKDDFDRKSRKSSAMGRGESIHDIDLGGGTDKFPNAFGISGADSRVSAGKRAGRSDTFKLKIETDPQEPGTRLSKKSSDQTENNRSRSFGGGARQSQKRNIFEGLEKVVIPNASKPGRTKSDPLNPAAIKGFDNAFFRDDLQKVMRARSPSPMNSQLKFLPDSEDEDSLSNKLFKSKVRKN